MIAIESVSINYDDSSGIEPTAEVVMIVSQEHISALYELMEKNNGLIDGKAALAFFGLKNVEEQTKIINSSGIRAIDL